MEGNSGEALTRNRLTLPEGLLQGTRIMADFRGLINLATAQSGPEGLTGIIARGDDADETWSVA